MQYNFFFTEVDILKLYNSGPAVLYSRVIFKAELKVTKIGLTPEIQAYKYGNILVTAFFLYRY